MGRKSDLLFQYSGLYLLFLATQFNDVVGHSHPHTAGVSLTPADGVLAKYVNSSTMVTCIPSPSTQRVRWISPTGDVVTNNMAENIHVEPGSGGAVALVLAHISSWDAGEWSCQLVDAREMIGQSFTLHVLQDIVFADTPTVQEGDEGTTVCIRCEASGKPEPHLKWYFNGMQVYDTPGKYKTVADGLVVMRLTSNDTGEYTCRAFQQSSYMVNAKSKVIRFNVMHKPIFVDHHQIYYAYFYGKAELVCEVIADPPANFSWTSKPVPSQYFRITQTGTSSILNITVNEREVLGNYTCVAENRLGKSKKVFQLKDGVKPAPPQTFIIKGVNKSTVHIEVEQDDVLNNGSQSLDEAEVVTGYRFHYITLDNYRNALRLRNDTFWFREWEVNKKFSENNSYLIGGLKSNTIYKMRVASVNLAGPSDFTEDKEFTTSQSGGGKGMCALVSVTVFFAVSLVFYQNY